MSISDATCTTGISNTEFILKSPSVNVTWRIFFCTWWPLSIYIYKHWIMLRVIWKASASNIECRVFKGLTVLMLLCYVTIICGNVTWGGWGCEVSCGGHHRPRGKTTTGSALDGAVFDIAQMLAYLVHNMSRSQLYLGFGHFVWLPSFFGQSHFGGLMVKLYFLCWHYSLFFLADILLQHRALFQC